ncbi:MAG TPA: glycosyl hydrolase [Chthonomonadaceae bacterium]|nr:glycosyl hydrolase [Chthonomonadaceae bacterium]
MRIWPMALMLLLAVQTPQKAIHLEAEDGRLVGVHVATTRKGYSGSGYVTGFDHDGARIVFTVPARAGIYEARIRYGSPFGEKGYALTVNGTSFSGMFPYTGDTFAVHSAGKVELKDGVNVLTIEKGWGYFDIDSLDLLPAAAPPPPRRTPVTLSDPQATARARALMAFLVSRYGKDMLSGQYSIEDCNYVRAVTGKTPAILGGDFMDYSPSRIAHGAKPDGTTEQLIAAAKAGQIVTLSWHWNAPKDLLDKTYKDAQGHEVDARWYKGFNTNATTFDLRAALADSNSEDYRLLLRDMDAIAAQLKKFAVANIPVLWRPLHEADGGWFWWGAKGPEAFKTLWRLMYERFTKAHGLHNLVWVCNSVRPDWYPGDAYVDIVGIDAYPAPSDPLSGTWEALQRQFDGRKLLAITEFGGAPDVEKMRRFGAAWSYFVSWSGELGARKLTKTDLIRIYRSRAVLNRHDVESALRISR